MISGFTTLCLVVLALACVLFKRLIVGPRLSRIRGPKSSSFVLGTSLVYVSPHLTDVVQEIYSSYSNVQLVKQTLNGNASTATSCASRRSLEQGNQLWVADPKALQWILHKSAYKYPKHPSIRIVIRLMIGKGIGWTIDNDHQRHRKVLLPGFGVPKSKGFLSVFQRCAESISSRWMEIVESSSDQKAVLNISDWLSRATLDAIGQAVFDVQFGAIDNNNNNPLVRTYNNMMTDVFGRPSPQQIFLQAATNYVPLRILEWLSDYGSHPRLTRAREVKRTATKIAKDMVQEKAESLLAGKGNRDIFSLLVKANMDTGAQNKLTDEELLAQMGSIIVAGHETTSYSLSWILLEVARHPEIQCRLRSEIREVEAAIRARGDTQFTVADFDVMSYTTAVIKEGLRYHPVNPYVHRVAARDDIFPLSRPVTTEMGEMTNEVLVTKGTQIVVSIAAYNRDTELWGEDAHTFNPDRWLDGLANRKKDISVGVYSNLMTFAGGARGCLGMHLAILEIQAFLVEIIGKFEFAMTDQAARVSRQLYGMMVPMVDGELERGSQLPLAVSIAAGEDDV